MVARIRQLEWRPEDVAKVKAKFCVARKKNKDRLDRTHRLQGKKIEEGDWVLLYDSSLDNQHKASRKFARRWFGPYVVTSANDNATYHIAELDRTSIAVPVTGKRIKAFKKRYGDKPGLGYGPEGDDLERADEDGEGGRTEQDE